MPRPPTRRRPSSWVPDGEAGDTDTTGTSSGLFDFVTIRQLWNNGYNVSTWDPRGFGQSGGSAEVDSPAVEGRDMERIISWVATRPGVQLDRPGEPRLGMVGVSYGAGIQLTTAAVDCRVDAIVPTWSWHSLATSLDKGNITKNGWSGLLYAALAGRPIDPHLVVAHQESLPTGVIDPAERAWFVQRGPGQLVDRIRAPTLFVQGEEDDLFTLDEAITNYGILWDNHVPTAMVWMCGGHGVCLTNPGNTQLVVTRTLDWLDRYVKDDRSVDVGPRFTFVDQNGVTYSASEYPLPTVRSITADGQGTLQLTAARGLGPRPSTSQQQRSSGSDRRPCHTGQGRPRCSTSTCPSVRVRGSWPPHQNCASPTGAPRQREAARRGSSRKSSMTPAVWYSTTRSLRWSSRWTAANTRPRSTSSPWPTTPSPVRISRCSWWPPRWPTPNPGWAAPSTSSRSTLLCRWSRVRQS